MMDGMDRMDGTDFDDEEGFPAGRCEGLPDPGRPAPPGRPLWPNPGPSRRMVGRRADRMRGPSFLSERSTS